LVFFLLTTFSAVAITASDYTDPAICGGCHDEIYEQWKGSMHSNSHADPLYQKLYLMASEETKGLTDTYCAKCHTPIGVLAGEIPPADGSKLSDISKLGVQCDFCHTINGSTGTGNAAYLSSPGNTKLGPFNDSTSPFHETAYSKLHTESEFCGMCHDVYHPVNGKPIEQTYTEWKNSPYNTGNPATTIHCQDCHMRQKPGLASTGLTERPNIAGRAARGAPLREHIFTHYFIGGNAILPGLLGSEEHNLLAIERLQKAATLEITAPEGVKAGEMATLKVKVTNSGAGHKLPTGLSEARQVWLEIMVKDGSGKTLYHSGALDENNMVDEKAVIYHAVLADKNGTPTVKVWEMEQVLSDNRIPPKQSSTEEYRFKIPPDAQNPITVVAKLNYQSANQALVDMLLGEGAVTVPTVEMASAEVSFDVAGAKPAGGETPSQPGFEVTGAITAGLIAMYLVWKKRQNA
jgi:hypothetical protein